MQAKQQRNSVSKSATRESIKEGDLKPDMKVSCDQFQSIEPGCTSNNNGRILSKPHAAAGAMMVDHASDFAFNFTQTSTEASQTVEAKHKFETFSKSCGVDMQHYHANNKIFQVRNSKKVVHLPNKRKVSVVQTRIIRMA